VIFARHLRGRVRSGEITASVRVWHAPRVKTGNLYRMEEGHILVDAVREIAPDAVTDAMARASGFADVADLMATARHGRGENVYLVEFHYVPPAARH
jgi:hypothetical protein